MIQIKHKQFTIPATSTVVIGTYYNIPKNEYSDTLKAFVLEDFTNIMPIGVLSIIE